MMYDCCMYHTSCRVSDWFTPSVGCRFCKRMLHNRTAVGISRSSAGTTVRLLRTVQDTWRQNIGMPNKGFFGGIDPGGCSVHVRA